LDCSDSPDSPDSQLLWKGRHHCHCLPPLELRAEGNEGNDSNAFILNELKKFHLCKSRHLPHTELHDSSIRDPTKFM